MGGEEFDGDGDVEGEVMGFVDCAHAAFAELGLDAAAADGAAEVWVFSAGCLAGAVVGGGGVGNGVTAMVVCAFRNGGWLEDGSAFAAFGFMSLGNGLGDGVFCVTVGAGYLIWQDIYSPVTVCVAGCLRELLCLYYYILWKLEIGNWKFGFLLNKAKSLAVAES